MSKKIYVLDTSVLIYDPEAIYRFGKNTVGIPITVLEELDKFKSENTERGATTRSAIRTLAELRLKGSLKSGVKLDNGGMIRVFLLPDGPCPVLLDLHVADNEILMLILHLKKDGHAVEFISKDLNARVKADALGIPAQDYIREETAREKLYKGWLQLEVSSLQLKKDMPSDLFELLKYEQLFVNQFVLLTSRNNPLNYKLFRYLGGKTFKPCISPQLHWPIQARNPQQLMALDLLLDPTIALVSLIGPAGTGKTLLALLAGLQQVLVTHEYRKMLISRPVVPLGHDIGYLPGTVEEKLRNWMQPMYDNMEFIAHTVSLQSNEFEPMANGYQEPRYVGKKGKKYEKKMHKESSFDSLDNLIKAGKVSLEAITYMRGRSIPFQYILFDEVQNLTPHEVKTLISRVGKGSKIILAGDPYQIDASYLSFGSNGLVVTSTKFTGQPLFGLVFLEMSTRSELSKLASELL